MAEEKKISYEEQDLEMMDDAKEFDYKGKKIKVYPISSKDAISLFNLKDSIADIDKEDDFLKKFGQDSELFSILSRAVKKSAKSLFVQTPTFLIWLANRILEVTDINFFSQEMTSLVKKIGENETSLVPSPISSDTSPEGKDGV